MKATDGERRPKADGPELDRAGRSLSELLDEWHAVHRLLGTTIGNMDPSPATDDQIRAAEAAAGFEFPADVWEWYRWSNGFVAEEGYAWKYFLPNGWASPGVTLPAEMAGALETGMLEGIYLSVVSIAQGDQLGAEAIPVDIVWLMEHDVLMGVECTGPRTGAVFWMGEGPVGWIARSLSDLIRRALRFYDQGLIYFDSDTDQMFFDEDAVKEKWPETKGTIAAWFNDPNEPIPEWPDSVIWRWRS